MKFWKLASVATIMVISSSVNAALIELDLVDIGDGLLTRDTNTGLTWLDLNETTNISYNNMETMLSSGGLFFGFRRATTMEVDQLFESAGIITRDWWSTLQPDIDGVSQLINLLGVNNTYNDFGGTGGRIGGSGFTSEATGLGHAISDYFLEDSYGYLEAYAVAFENGSGADQYSFSETGHYLVVSSVPVPAAVWLFGSGLIGLVGFAKRKKT